MDFTYLRRAFLWEDGKAYVSFLSTYVSWANLKNAFSVGVLLPIMNKYLKLPDLGLCFLGSLGGMYSYIILLTGKR